MILGLCSQSIFEKSLEKAKRRVEREKKAKIKEDKLKAYQELFNLTDKIISDYPGSDQTIKLLSNQKIGEFDTQLIRSNYINELTDYYDIICETSPTFLCLCFVSLKVGQSGCE